MNKLEKFYILKQYGLPCPKFYEYNGETIREDGLLSIRCVMRKGKDTSLSKATGIFKDVANEKAREFKNKYGDDVIIFYYNYFLASISGTLLVEDNEAYAEIVKGNLWNMKDGKDIDLVATYRNGKISVLGNSNIINSVELVDLFSFIENAKKISKNDNIILSWSLTDKREVIFYNFKTLDKNIETNNN